jgi:hypothetical protein
VLSHWIGIVGETLNFTGALVLARDLFLREQEHKLRTQLEMGKDMALRIGLERTRYEKTLLSSQDFTSHVLNRRTAFLAYWGTGLLAGGFLCLVVYHGLELVVARP